MTDYFNAPGVSQSQLKDFARCPAYYHAKHVARTLTSPTTAAMALGTAIHARILEPATYGQRYAVKDWDARTGEGKARRDLVLASGRTVLDEDDAATVEAVACEVMRHPVASKLIAGASTEVPLFWNDDDSGLDCKGKLDGITVRGGYMFDLKSTTDASPDAVSRSIAQRGYHVQAAHYMAGARANGHNITTYTLIVVETSAPHLVAVYELDAAAIDVGESRRREMLDRLAECQRANVWPGYESQMIGLPKWAL